MTWTRADWWSSGGESQNGMVEERKGREGLEKKTHITLFKELYCKKEQKLGASVTQKTNGIKGKVFFLNERNIRTFEDAKEKEVVTKKIFKIKKQVKESKHFVSIAI